MNNAYVKQSLKELILSNESELVGDFVHQGNQRFIKHIALTNLDPPHGYYYILIYIPDASTFTQTEGKTVRRPRETTEYTVQMEISDQAVVQPGDWTSEAYETMALDFDKFVGRLIELVRGVNFTDDENTIRLKRDISEADRRIDRADLSGNYQNTEQENVALLYSQLRFTLEEQCVDTSRLHS